jgi:hypothetical protein
MKISNEPPVDWRDMFKRLMDVAEYKNLGIAPVAGHLAEVEWTPEELAAIEVLGQELNADGEEYVRRALGEAGAAGC